MTLLAGSLDVLVSGVGLVALSAAAGGAAIGLVGWARWLEVPPSPGGSPPGPGDRRPLAGWVSAAPMLLIGPTFRSCRAG